MVLDQHRTSTFPLLLCATHLDQLTIAVSPIKLTWLFISCFIVLFHLVDLFARIDHIYRAKRGLAVPLKPNQQALQVRALFLLHGQLLLQLVSQGLILLQCQSRSLKDTLQLQLLLLLRWWILGISVLLLRSTVR